MSQTSCIERPRTHDQAQEQPAVRFVVLIDAAATGSRVARLFLASREPAAEFDAAAPEVQMLTRDLAATNGALGPEWDLSLAGHSAEERRRAEVFTLET